MPIVYPVIVVPGITATYLKDQYFLTPEEIWTVLRKDYERAMLHPNDLRYEAKEPARIQPDRIFQIAYKELIEELRFNLMEKKDIEVPVYPFAYDWRMPLSEMEVQLDKFIDEVMARTKLMKHYHNAGYSDKPKVNLVGHSMGGLIITGYLEMKGKKAPINKVATLATPFQGSFEAVIKVATGTANLGTDPPSSREREMARITPALYHLIPNFKNSIETSPGIPDNLFDSNAWQPDVVDTIAQIIRIRGLPSKAPKKDALTLFKQMLSEAQKHQKRIHNFKLQNCGLKTNDWLAVIGTDSVTRVQVEIIRLKGKIHFNLRSTDRKNEWDQAKPGSNPRLTGDGTVPFEGAIPPFLGEDNLVIVTPDDFGYWELQDKALTKLAGFHGILPNMNMLHRLLVRFFTGRPDKHKNTWGRPAPGVAVWNPPLPLTNKNKK